MAAAILKESIQHPATIYPLAGSALALSWTLMIAASPVSIGAALGLAFVGGSAFVYNYVIKGPERAEEYVKRLRDRRRQAISDSLLTLSAQFYTEGLPDGAKEAGELKEAFDQLSQFLCANDKIPSVGRFSVLAEDSLRQGVQTLQQALDVKRAIRSVDIRRLENEVEQFRRQMNSAKSPAETSAYTQQIESHTRTINLYRQSQEKLAQLLAESNDIESALRSTYMEIVDFGSGDFDTYLRQDGGAVSRLNQAVQAARRVEERLRGQDDEKEIEKRNKYIEASQESDNSRTH